MLERFRNRSDDDERGGAATATRRETVRDERTGDARVREGERRFVRDGDRATGAVAARQVRARQREEFGGINWGSAFFGWLVAVGMAALLLGLLSAAGAAFGLSEIGQSDARENAETIGLVGGLLLIGVLLLAYLCGGYVSGRMSRFDGGRQGMAVWLLGLAVTITLAVAGAIFGSEYNVLERLNLPRIPIEEGTLTAGAVVTLVAVVIGTLIAATIGGKAGERYHKKIDRVGYRI
jgi:hypothetical protein